MSTAVLEEMKQYIGFSEQDARNLATLREYVEPHLPQVVERFARVVDENPSTREVLASTPERRSELRRTLSEWLQGLFTGRYDETYWQQRAEIGQTHMRIGLPQHFMVVANEVVWRELEDHIHAWRHPDKHELLHSLHKLLTLETGLTVEGYRRTYAEHVRQLERDAIQAQLNEARQLAQIGQLAASLAHEIKNPLAGISGAIQVIRDSLRPTDRHWPVLGEVQRQIIRLDRTVQDLLVYARPKPPSFRKCSLPKLIERVRTLLNEESGFQRVQFEYAERERLPRIEADEIQLEQLLMNLLLNAAQASEEGGLVRLTTSKTPRGVRLVVEDRGCGMNQETRRRALEPFFTTKSRGTGLGLPICSKIVEAHGGRLSIASTRGAGTTVTVDLPRFPPKL